MHNNKIDELIKKIYNITDEKKLNAFKDYLYFFGSDVSLQKYSEIQINKMVEKYLDDILLNRIENELGEFLKEFNSFIKNKLINKTIVKKQKKEFKPYEGCIDVYHIDWNGAEYTLTSIKSGEQMLANNKIDNRQLKNAISKNKLVILKDFNGKLKYRIVKNKYEL